MNKQLYMKPECECTVLMGGEICDMIHASQITGSTDQPDLPEIGDGGDNDDGVPLPSAKEFANLWNFEDEEDD